MFTSEILNDHHTIVSALKWAYLLSLATNSLWNVLSYKSKHKQLTMFSFLYLSCEDWCIFEWWLQVFHFVLSYVAVSVFVYKGTGEPNRCSDPLLFHALPREGCAPFGFSFFQELSSKLIHIFFFNEWSQQHSKQSLFLWMNHMQLHTTLSENSGITPIELRFKSVPKSGSWAFVTACLMSLDGYLSFSYSIMSAKK